MALDKYPPVHQCNETKAEADKLRHAPCKGHPGYVVVGPTDSYTSYNHVG